jgi:phage baseplate assembly protein W
MTRNVAFPYRIDGRGRTAEAQSDDAHLQDLIEQLLFTMPGERVNRPDFGCGLMQLVFAPNSVELAATVQALVHGALQQWLGYLLRIDEVAADAQDSTLTVTVAYTVLRTQTSKVASFTQKVPT